MVFKTGDHVEGLTQRRHLAMRECCLTMLPSLEQAHRSTVASRHWFNRLAISRASLRLSRCAYPVRIPFSVRPSGSHSSMEPATDCTYAPDRSRRVGQIELA